MVGAATAELTFRIENRKIAVLFTIGEKKAISSPA